MFLVEMLWHKKAEDGASELQIILKWKPSSWFCVLQSKSHPVHWYAAKHALMIYVADTWQPLIRYLLVAGSGDKTNG